MNIFKEAKKVQKKFPKLSWQQAIKRASKEANKSPRQTGTSARKVDNKLIAKKPGKRKSATGKVYYERRKNRSDAPGSLTGMKGIVKQKLAAALLRYELADTVAATKKAKVEVNKYRKLLRSL